MFRFKTFWNILTEAVEDVELPSEIFDDYTTEVTVGTKRTKIVVKSNDRDADRDEVGRRLKQQGITFSVKSVRGITTSFDPISLKYEDREFAIAFKPIKGGMAETTINSSITELFPCIIFSVGIRKLNVMNLQYFFQYYCQKNSRDKKYSHTGKNIINRKDISNIASNYPS